MMKHVLIILLLFLTPYSVFGQTAEKQYYIYNIVSFEGDFKSGEVRAFYDDGNEVKRLKDKKGNKIKFKTPAGALMYFISQGWELYLNGATTEGAMFNGLGASTSSPYWILRKPCSKETFEKTAQNAIVK